LIEKGLVVLLPSYGIADTAVRGVALVLPNALKWRHITLSGAWRRRLRSAATSPVLSIDASSASTMKEACMKSIFVASAAVALGMAATARAATETWELDATGQNNASVIHLVLTVDGVTDAITNGVGDIDGYSVSGLSSAGSGYYLSEANFLSGGALGPSWIKASFNATSPANTVVGLSSPFSSVSLCTGGTCSSLSLTGLLTAVTLQQVASPVPEPATWITMIVGFGAIGAMMRRRPGPVAAPA
jgi:hypothetical protein